MKVGYSKGLDLEEKILELIKKAATDLPADVEDAIMNAYESEEQGSAARSALGTILENVKIARSKTVPMCQDTGVPIFYIHLPENSSITEKTLKEKIINACKRATNANYLRPNSVESISGKNTGYGTGSDEGIDIPYIHIERWDNEKARFDLLLKGGGSENVSCQYKLPDSALGAGRDLEGVRKCVLDAIYQAQGKGCSPGIVGICIGGDRATGYIHAKRQLFRNLTDTNSEPILSELEERIKKEANSLGIGPMGFGGKTTVLGVKIGALHRLPACYFVSASYNCWALRRASIEVDL